MSRAELVIESASFARSARLTEEHELPTALEIIQRDHVNVLEGVPTMYSAMLHHPEHEQCHTWTIPGAAYQCPRKIGIVDDLPEGATGKILKREVEPPDEA